MEVLEKVRKMLVVLLCAAIVLGIVSGQNMKKAYGEGYEKEEQQDEMVFASNVSKENLQLKDLERIEFESQIMDLEEVTKAVGSMAGVECNSAEFKEDSQGLRYEDEKNGVVISYNNKVQDKNWIYINSSVQEDVTAITKSESEIKSLLYNKLTDYGYEVEENPTVEQDNQEMSSEIKFTYQFVENGIPVDAGDYSIGKKDVVAGGLNCEIAYRNKGIAVLYICGYKPTNREPFTVKKNMWEKAKQMLLSQIEAMDNTEDWKHYSVEDAKTVYLPTYGQNSGAVKRELVPAVKFRCLVTSYDYQTDECSTTTQYFIYNMEQEIIACCYTEK